MLWAAHSTRNGSELKKEEEKGSIVYRRGYGARTVKTQKERICGACGAFAMLVPPLTSSSSLPQQTSTRHR
ncbi:hypothetical protein HPB50_023295 [Hyalomma asiaticum]|uniref:Uncharacterized protein n=1 Tax=Hyalomma asiaticum TaxID=266040 RepID=A0ACB7TMI3_HYAAI|nr:hypothetical protein HPB50_023295 [Hyalomma asiaticum]